MGKYYRMPKGGYYYEPVYRPLAEADCLEDIKKYDWPRAGNPCRIEGLKRLRDRAKQLQKNGYLVQVSSGWISIFEQTRGYRGFENFMIDLATNQKFAASIMD